MDDKKPTKKSAVKLEESDANQVGSDAQGRPTAMKRDIGGTKESTRLPGGTIVSKI